MVGENLKKHVRISDFGMSRALANESTYYKMSSDDKLPIRWMAIESIEDWKFTTFSDGKYLLVSYLHLLYYLH